MGYRRVGALFYVRGEGPAFCYVSNEIGSVDSRCGKIDREDKDGHTVGFIAIMSAPELRGRLRLNTLVAVFRVRKPRNLPKSACKRLERQFQSLHDLYSS